MGREVRMVPPGWSHPRDKRGNFIPLLGQTVEEYDREKAAWERRDLSGLPSYVTTDCFDRHRNYRSYAGPRYPRSRMPSFPPGVSLYWRMYETTSEGTPISPACPTMEELAQWLADNGASACGSMTATREQWLAMIRRGSACSMVYDPSKGLVSGVEYESDSR